MAQYSALWKDGNKFDNWINWLESEVGGPKHTVSDLRKDSKAEKGKIWEQFCADWLVASQKLDVVFLWNEIPSDIRQELGLRTQDIGIDLIGWKGEKIFAIQAKYRKTSPQRPVKVNWRELSTFWGLVARTGILEQDDIDQSEHGRASRGRGHEREHGRERGRRDGGERKWDGHWVCTNCSGVTWKVSKTSKDRVFAIGTFRATPLSVWYQMAGTPGHRLNMKEHQSVYDTEEIRERRLNYFSNT